MKSLTLEEAEIWLQQVAEEMTQYAADELEALPPGEAAAIVNEVVETKRRELHLKHKRGGYRVAEDEVLKRWDLNY